MGRVCCLNNRCLIVLLPGHACLGLVAGGRHAGTGVSADSSLTQHHPGLHPETPPQRRAPLGLSVFLGSAGTSDILKSK